MNTNKLMKTKILCLILALSIFLVAGACNKQDKTTYENLLKERDSVLSELVKIREAQFKEGALPTIGDVWAAQLALCEFRRDTAKSKKEEMKQRELIIDICEKRIKFVKLQMSQGTASSTELLGAKDKLLQEKLSLEKLRLNIK